MTNKKKLFPTLRMCKLMVHMTVDAFPNADKFDLASLNHIPQFQASLHRNLFDNEKLSWSIKLQLFSTLHKIYSYL